MKIFEALKRHFENTSQEELDKEWEDIKYLNEIGPDAQEYIINSLKENLHSYLVERFLRCNHNKYKHLYQEWVDHLTYDQLNYFILEKERIEKNNMILK